MKSGKRILLLTQVLPYPPDSGPKVKTWNVLKYLGQRHDITLVSFIRGEKAEEIGVLEQHCRRVLPVRMERTLAWDLWSLFRSFINNSPFLMIRDDRPAMRKLLRSIRRSMEYDVVHVDQLNMAQFSWEVPAKWRVLDAHNSLWHLYRRMYHASPPGPRKWLLAREWRLLRSYEGRISHSFDAITAVSVEDRESLIEAGAPAESIQVIPISVDTDELAPIARDSGPKRIVHLGTMFWPPNADGVLWFLREVWPKIRARRPDVEFDVIGMRPPRQIRAFGGNGQGVHVTGYVENPIPFLKRAAAFVVPLRAGGGMRVKILNALAQGLPVVTTTIGCEGIEVIDGVHLLIANSATEFAQATLRLLDHPELAIELARKGRELIVERYDYRHLFSRLDAIYAGATE